MGHVGSLEGHWGGRGFHSRNPRRLKRRLRKHWGTFGGQSRVYFGNHVSVMSITSRLSRQHRQVTQATITSQMGTSEESRVTPSASRALEEQMASLLRWSRRQSIRGLARSRTSVSITRHSFHTGEPGNGGQELARISQHVWTLLVGCRKGGASATPEMSPLCPYRAPRSPSADGLRGARERGIIRRAL